MTRQLTWTTGCLLLTMTGLVGLSDAHAATGPINVTALPAPCPSAIPNDGLDDTAAIQCALTNVPGGAPDGGAIYIPAGTYDLSATLVITDKRIAIHGEGQGITRLVWHQTSAPDHDGIQFVSTLAPTQPPNPPNINYTLAVRSLSLLRESSNGGAALSARWGKPAGHSSLGIVTATIHDVHTGSDPWTSSAYWHFGIMLINSTNAKISDFNIQGPGWDGGVAGIQIRGTDSSGKSISVRIRNGSVTRYARGIESKDEAEGVHVQDVSMHEVGRGVQMWLAGPGTAIANNTIQARFSGVQVLDCTQRLAITNNVIRRFDDAAFTGIELSTPNRDSNVVVIGNTIDSPTPGQQARYGILLGGSVNDSAVQGNTTNNMTVGIFLQTQSGVTPVRTTVMGNINRNAATQWIDNAAPGVNYFAHNIP